MAPGGVCGGNFVFAVFGALANDGVCQLFGDGADGSCWQVDAGGGECGFSRSFVVVGGEAVSGQGIDCEPADGVCVCRGGCGGGCKRGYVCAKAPWISVEAGGGG